MVVARASGTLMTEQSARYLQSKFFAICVAFASWQAPKTCGWLAVMVLTRMKILEQTARELQRLIFVICVAFASRFGPEVVVTFGSRLRAALLVKGWSL